MKFERNLLDTRYKRQYECIFDILWSKKGLFDLDKLFTLKTWYLLAYIRSQLYTDDSFQFTKNIKFLIECIEEFVISENEKTSDVLIPENEYRINTILLCLESAYDKYTWQWAKQHIELAFNCITKKRHILTSDVRERLDKMANTFEAERRKNVSWSGPQTIRTYNSISHPLQKKSGLLR